MKLIIDDKLVRSIVPNPDDDVYVWDTRLSGFHLKVTSKGKRVFVYLYRNKDGRQRKLTLGSSESMSAKIAYELAVAASAAVSKGLDPQAEKERVAVERAAEPNVAVAWELWDQAHFASLKPDTVEEYRRLWKTAVPEWLKRKYLANISKAGDYEEVQRRVTRKDMQKIRDSFNDRPAMGNVVLRRLSAFFNWCEGDGQLVPPGSNPLYKMKKLPARSRHFVFSRAHLYRFGTALDEAEATTWLPIILAIRFLLLSGFRREEALKLRWAYVDFEKRLITLPDSKTGESERVIGSELLKVLERAKQFQDLFPSPYVFPSPRDRSKPLQNIRDAMERICTKAGIPYGRDNGGVWIHGLRHNFGGYGAQVTKNAVHVRDMLGHTQISTTDGYMKSVTDTLIEAADATTQAIAGDMAPGNVVKLGGAR